MIISQGPVNTLESPHKDTRIALVCECTSDGSTLMLFNFNLRILQLEIQKAHKKELCSKPRWPCGKERDRTSLVEQRSSPAGG